MSRRRHLRFSLFVTACVAIAGCTAAPTERSALLGESYHAIDVYYLRHIETRRVGEASLGALAKRDPDIAVDANDRGLLLEHRSQTLAIVAAPSAEDWKGWGEAAAQMAAAAAKASPAIGALSPAVLDQLLIDGAVTALDPFSRYLPPGTKEDRLIEGGAAPDAMLAALPSGIIRPPSVRVAVDSGLAIAGIGRFTGSTPAMLRRELDRVFLGGRAPRGIVLDLRDNPGGQLSAALEVADLFLDHGVIVGLEGRDPADLRVFRAKSDGTLYESIPLAVLINDASTSAAEVVAAALQGNDRAVIIGSASYGKGTAQRIVPLANGGELWLTSTYMRAPAGYLLQHHGVIPDICTWPSRDMPKGGRGNRASDAQPFHRPAATDLAALDEFGWLTLRLSCSSWGERRDSDRELAVAEQWLIGTASARR
jgi:Peptidase family S41